MTLKARITDELTKAMKGGDKFKVSTLRFLLSAVKYAEIEKRGPVRGELTDEEIHGVISTAAKQRRDSIEQFKKGNRADLVEKEEKELEILKTYLPAQITGDELLDIVKDVAKEAGASTPADMGKLMKAVMARLKGRADGKEVQEAVKIFLSK